MQDTPCTGEKRVHYRLPSQREFGRDGREDVHNVRLILQGGEENLALAAFVHEQDKAGSPLSLEELIVLNHLEHQRRIDIPTVGMLTQKGDAYARSLMERLVERGLIEPRGEKKGRVYHLSASLYRHIGAPTAYVHAHGFEPIQQEQMVLQYLEKYKNIKRADVIKLCKLGPKQATQLLNRMVRKGRLLQMGKKRGSYYTLSREL